MNMSGTTIVAASPSLDGVSDQVQNHTEQAAIELVYIKQANQIIGNAMDNLTSAMNASQSALNLLSMLQEFHNQLSVSTPSNFPFNFQTGQPTTAFLALGGYTTQTSALKTILPGTSLTSFSQLTNLPASTYQTIYEKIASVYYGTAINPTANSLTNSQANLTSILNVRAELLQEMKKLSSMTSALQKGNGSLLFSLKTVYNELPTDFNSYKNWVLDDYASKNGMSSARGKIEADLTTAITAAQSLNNTQTENVREFLFVFQEYYQSAAAILSTITTTISDMAQKISQ